MYTVRVLVTLIMISITGVAMGLEPYTATYKLSRGNFKVGETRYELRIQADGQVLFRAHAETQGLISLLRSDEIIEESRLKLNEEGQLIAEEYIYRHQRGDRIEEEKRIDFDWAKGMAVSRVDDESWELPIKPGTTDRMSLQLKVMQDARCGDQDERMVYHAIDEDELEEFEFTLEGEYVVTTGAGEFRSLRLQREHGSRTTIFWVAPDLGYLPVRVEQRREDHATISLELEAVSGPLVADQRDE